MHGRIQSARINIEVREAERQTNTIWNSGICWKFLSYSVHLYSLEQNSEYSEFSLAVDNTVVEGIELNLWCLGLIRGYWTIE